MSEAWNLFARCLSKGWNEFWPFVKIWFTTILVLFIFVMIVGYFYSNNLMILMIAEMDPTMVTPDQQMELMSSMSGMTLWILLFGILSLLISSGLSVNSLRYYFGNYTPSWVPFQFDWSATFAFIGWSIVLGFIGIAIFLIPAILSTWIVGMSMNNGSTFLTFIGWALYAIGFILMFWIIFRLYNKLVGRAVGEVVSFGEAWNKTKGSGVFYFSLVLFMAVVYWLFSLALGLLFGILISLFTSPTMLFIVGLIFVVISFLFTIYIYAAFYAVCVEVYKKFFGTTKTQ